MPDLPSLRRPDVAVAIGEALREAARRPVEACRLRVVEFSIQVDHLHLIVESENEIDLAHGMRGLGVRLARGVNRVLGRRGSFASDRYHARELRTPRETRNALVYVIGNWLKHGRGEVGVDPCSSARWFPGFTTPLPAPSRPPPVHRARTWLGAVGWRLHRGPIRVGEAPASRR
jgi:REP element-mobilizing transposase RayT